MKYFTGLLLIGCCFLTWSCRQAKTADDGEDPYPSDEALPPFQDRASAAVPAWSYDANIYEVNIRQFTPEGTLNAFRRHLPRLQDLGVEILWLMPIYPISEERRKGTLGSYYAISDYTAVNPNFGTAADFRALVEEVHELGMRIILDFVPNHTGWDHPWIEEHPDYYTQDAAGNIVDPFDPETGASLGWTDVADLNYDNQDLRAAMVEELLYWVDSFGIDGYRMDVAYEVPTDFLVYATERLRRAEPEIFLLAEAEKPQLRNRELFAADYGWEFHHLLNDLAQGKVAPRALIRWQKEDQIEYDRGFHMHFITNHDENSWNGTVFERMGENVAPCAVIAFTYDGMPLIYGGQEAGLDKRLKFFEKDEISWSDTSRYAFYRALLRTKRNNPALWNGEAGGALQILPAPHPRKTFAYARVKAEHAVLVFVNLDEEPREFRFEAAELAGEYRDIFTQTTSDLPVGSTFTVPAHGYRVLSRQVAD